MAQQLATSQGQASSNCHLLFPDHCNFPVDLAPLSHVFFALQGKVSPWNTWSFGALGHTQTAVSAIPAGQKDDIREAICDMFACRYHPAEGVEATSLDFTEDKPGKNVESTEFLEESRKSKQKSGTQMDRLEDAVADATERVPDEDASKLFGFSGAHEEE